MVADDDDSYPAADSQEMQVALAMSALAQAFVGTLQELHPDEDDVAGILLTKMAVVFSEKLRQPRESVRGARQMFRVVRDTLRTQGIPIQSDD